MSTLKETAKISVIVPFLNSEATIDECLQALISQNLKPSEIIMVDNGSTDRSKVIVNNFANKNGIIVKYFYESKKGPACARNLGIRNCIGNIIAFTDSDCVPDPDWLKNLIIEFQNPQVAAVAGIVESYKTETLYDKFHALFTLKGFEKSQIFSKFNLVSGGFPTANLAVRKDVLIKLNSFDETLADNGEDYDLCDRIYRHGLKIKYIPDAVIYHKHRSTLIGTFKQGYGFGKSHAVLLKKHCEKIAIVHFPRYKYISQKWPFRLWIDLAGLDKKVLLLTALSMVWWVFIIPLALYPIFLYLNLKSRLNHNRLNVNFIEILGIEFLLLIKSFAITSGRIISGFRNKVICC